VRIDELVETLDLPETAIAERAWEDARRRVRRRRGAAAAGAAALAVTCVVGVTVALRPDAASVPTPAPPPSPSRTVAQRTAPLVQQLWMHGHWRSAVRGIAFVPGSAAPPGVSTDPVRRAALAINAPGDPARVLVLGEDGRWRGVDVPGLVPAGTQKSYPRPILRPTSLSPDATKLALPQPNALVVVDLAKGTSRRYDVPGPGNLYPAWTDDTHVLLTAEGARHGTVVDLADGSRTPSPYGETTAFADGTTVTWDAGGPTHSTLVWGDGRQVRTLGDNGGGFFPQPPLVKDGVVVGVGGLYSDSRAPAVGTIGINVVDGSSGKVLAYLPVTTGDGTDAKLLGWDGGHPLIGLPHPGVVNLDVFAWDWQHGTLDPVASVGARDVSWGTGRFRE
jgi:hypothetical protein